MSKSVNHNILITGASGYLGRLLVNRFLERNAAGSNIQIWATDIKANPFPEDESSIHYLQADIRSDAIYEWIGNQEIDSIYHLAAILSPGPGMSRTVQHEIDVLATQKLIEYCFSKGTRRLILTSSGAVYGYRAENPEWLKETDPVHPNEDYAYSWHKYLVEQFLTELKKQFKDSEIFIFRVGTILGEKTDNPITQMMKRDPVILIKGAETPFVAIWDQDVINIFEQASTHPIPGVYNVAGDGKVNLETIAKWQGSRTRRFSASGLRMLFRILKFLRLSPYGPDQVKFIQFRPVLNNHKLKTIFEYTPQKTSEETIRFYLHHQNRLK